MEKTLTFAEITERMNKKGKGHFTYITYYSEKKTIDGGIIYKVASKVPFLAKINGKNRKCYVAPTSTRNEDSTYIVENAVKHNNKTNNDLLVLHLVNKKHKVQYFTENGTEISEAEATARIVPTKSYGGIPTTITVNCTKVLYLK